MEEVLRIRWGLVPQLLLPMLLSLILGIGAVEAWTAHVSREAIGQEVEHELLGDMRLLKAYLSPLGTEWSADNGELRLGYAPLAGHNDIVDAATGSSHGVATIFAGDTRIATSVRTPDGKRSIGTKLNNPSVQKRVLEDGQTFQGMAKVLGREYLSIYEPIRDYNGKVVGMLVVGQPVETLDAPQEMVLRGSVTAGAVAVLGFGAVMVWAIRRTLRPLLQLAQTTIDMAAGDLNAALPGIARRDEIGHMAQAVEVFRTATIQKEELEKARSHAAAEQALVVRVVASGLEQLAAGDVTIRLNETLPMEYECLRDNFNAASAGLEMLVQGIYDSSGKIACNVAEVARAADDLNRRTETQAATIEQTAAALNQITATVAQTASSASNVHQVVSRVNAGAKGSDEVMRQMTATMDGIFRSSSEIGRIVGVIQAIAAQSNFLSLNAGIEAVRAGDGGRSFSVVAAEVRALAAKTAVAASEIQTHAGASGQHVGGGVLLVDKTGRTLDEIVTQISEVDDLVCEIAAAAAAQAVGLAEVNRAVSRIDQVTQQNAAMVEQTSAASQALAREATELVRLTHRFNVRKTASDLTHAACQ